MTVYGDLLFLINFSMDFLCFYLSFLLIREKLKTIRVCISSILGGIYSVAALFLEADGVLAFLIDILFLLLMCAIVYCEKGIGFFTFIKRVLLYFIVSSLLGGFMTSLFSLLNKIELFGEDVSIDEGIEVWIFAILVLLSSVMTIFGGRVFRQKGVEKKAIVEIKDNGREAKLRALVDSGNLAYEPISGKSVIFARLGVCRELFSESEYVSLSEGNEMNEMPLALAMRVRPIFSNSIGGNRILPSIRFKSVHLVYEKRRKYIDVYIAFVDDESINGYDAIISNELIT